MREVMKKAALLMVYLMLLPLLGGCDSRERVSPADARAEEFDPITGEPYPKEVNIAVVEGSVEAAILIKQEYFKVMDARVNLIVYSSGTEINNAMVSGDVDMASFGLSPVVIGMVRGVPYKAVYIPYIQAGNIEALVAKREVGAERVSDLKGKIIAVPFGSTSHYALLNALRLSSLSSEEVTILDMGGQDIVAAWKRGDIDAAYIWNPALNECQADGVILINDGDLVDQGILIPEIAVADTLFSEKYPTLVGQYVRALMEVCELAERDPNQAVADVADWEGISAENARTQVLDNIWIKGRDQLSPDYLGNGEQKGGLAKVLKEAADFHREQGNIRESVDKREMEDAIDPDFVKLALKIYEEGEKEDAGSSE